MSFPPLTSPAPLRSSSSIKLPTQAKRSACDRCRGQKLRCNRSEYEGAPCIRCARAKAVCITSPPRSTGRPPRGSVRERAIRKQKSYPSTRNSGWQRSDSSTSRLYKEFARAESITSTASEPPLDVHDMSSSMGFSCGPSPLPSYHLSDTEWEPRLMHSHGFENTCSTAIHSYGPTEPLLWTPENHSYSLPQPSYFSMPTPPFSYDPQLAPSWNSALCTEPASYILNGATNPFITPLCAQDFSASSVPILDLQNADYGSHANFPLGAEIDMDTAANCDTPSTVSEPDLLEHCILQLYDLSRELQRQMSRVEILGWAGILTSDDQKDHSRSSHDVADQSQEPAIQDLFGSSEKLLAVISQFAPPVKDVSSVGRSFVQVAETAFPMSTEGSVPRRTISNSSDLGKLEADLPGFSTQAGGHHRLPYTPPPSANRCHTTSPRPDTTIVVQTLGCYRHLLGLYNSLFAHVQALLQTTLCRDPGFIRRIDGLVLTSTTTLRRLQSTLGLGPDDVSKPAFLWVDPAKYQHIVSMLATLEGGTRQESSCESEALEHRIGTVRALLDQVRS